MPDLTEKRIYIFGASGAGSTTLGARIAKDIGVVHIDSDHHYWAPSDPPYSKVRSLDDRLASITKAFGTDGWVLAGACHQWGRGIVDPADLIVFLTLPTRIRIDRLIARETERFGGRILEGGDMYETHKAFIEWTLQYDDPNFSGRNRNLHEIWLSNQTKPICRIEGNFPVEHSRSLVLDHLNALP